MPLDFAISALLTLFVVVDKDRHDGGVRSRLPKTSRHIE